MEQQTSQKRWAIWEIARNLPNIRVPSLVALAVMECESARGCIRTAYKCYIFVTGGEALRDKILTSINEKGVPCFLGSCPEVYLEAASTILHSGLETDCRSPKSWARQVLCCCVTTLTNDEIEKTCHVLREVAFELCP